MALTPLILTPWESMCALMAKEFSITISDENFSSSETEGEDDSIKEGLKFSDEEDKKYEAALLERNPPPRLHGDLDLGGDFSCLDALGDIVFGEPLSTHPSKKRLPSKHKSAKKREEPDDCRPDLEKGQQFNLLASSKKKLCLTPQKLVSTQDSSDIPKINLVSPKLYYNKMAKKKVSTQPKPVDGSDVENNSPSEQRNAHAHLRNGHDSEKDAAQKHQNDAQVDDDAAEQGADYTITHPEILAMSQAYQDKFVQMYLEVLRKDKKLTQSKRMQALRKSREQKLIYQFIVNNLQKKLGESAGKDEIIATLQADLEQEKLKVDHRSIQAKSRVMKENEDEKNGFERW
jgi:hypothetical protein